MISTQHYYMIGLLFLCLFPMNHALECKVCDKYDPKCLLGESAATRQCDNDNDVCYSWFERSGSQVGVQRDCISTDVPEYEVAKSVLGHKNSGCIRRLNGLDCFKFCMQDNCN